MLRADTPAAALRALAQLWPPSPDTLLCASCPSCLQAPPAYSPALWFSLQADYRYALVHCCGCSALRTGVRGRLGSGRGGVRVGRRLRHRRRCRPRCANPRRSLSSNSPLRPVTHRPARARTPHPASPALLRRTLPPLTAAPHPFRRCQFRVGSGFRMSARVSTAGARRLRPRSHRGLRPRAHHQAARAPPRPCRPRPCISPLLRTRTHAPSPAAAPAPPPSNGRAVPEPPRAATDGRFRGALPILFQCARRLLSLAATGLVSPLAQGGVLFLPVDVNLPLARAKGHPYAVGGDECRPVPLSHFSCRSHFPPLPRFHSRTVNSQ